MDIRFSGQAPSGPGSLWLMNLPVEVEFSNREQSNDQTWPSSFSRKVVFIDTLHDAAHELTRSIPITLERYSDGWVAYTYEIDEIALGPDESSALDDMRAAIVARYDLLIEHEASLGPLQQRHLAYLKQIVRETGV